MLGCAPGREPPLAEHFIAHIRSPAAQPQLPLDAAPAIAALGLAVAAVGLGGTVGTVGRTVDCGGASSSVSSPSVAMSPGSSGGPGHGSQLPAPHEYSVTTGGRWSASWFVSSVRSKSAA